MKIEQLDKPLQAAVFEYFLRLGDDALIMGHRLSEWCGHAPILEEDIALGNIALDYLGHANMFLDSAGKVEGKGRDADALAFWRSDREFRNLQLVEQPRGDFAFTICKIFLFSAYETILLEKLSNSSLEELASLAAKALKEVKYHLRHGAEWMVRLGDGTKESRARLERSLQDLWSYTPELFESDSIIEKLVAGGLIPNPSGLHSHWIDLVSPVLTRATLALPAEPEFRSRGSRAGLHTEHLGHLLAEMQILPRSFPGASW